MVKCRHEVGSDPFQNEGIYFALSRPGTLLADEMGVGKTIQAVGVINADPALGKVLIVCPASMRIPWRIELERWLVRPMNVGVVGVDRLTGEELFLHSEVVVINYDRLHHFKTLLQSCQWDLAILDECHYCKSPEARRTKAAIGIQARRRMALSGTPLQNRPVELLPMLTWLDPIHSLRSPWLSSVDIRFRCPIILYWLLRYLRHFGLPCPGSDKHCVRLVRRKCFIDSRPEISDFSFISPSAPSHRLSIHIIPIPII